MRGFALAGLAIALTACGPDVGDPDASPGTNASKSAPAEADAAAVLARGRVAWRQCAKCHCPSDPRVERDADWARLNETTACIAQGAPAPALRAAIIRYLNDADTLRPLLVGKDELPAGVSMGQIAVPAEAGSAYLRAERASIKQGSPAMVRIQWEKTADEKYIDAPAGSYDVINFWHYRGVKDERWMLSGTDVTGAQTLAVDPHAPEFLELEPILEPRFAATRKGDTFKLSLSIHDPTGSRVTVSRSGRLVIPRYRIRAANGDVLAEAALVPS